MNYTGSVYGEYLYFTGSNFRKNNLCIITNNADISVNIAIPTADYYSPGTVVEFDIIAATGSTWQIVTVNNSGNLTNGFIAGLRPGAATAPEDANDYQDFNPFWNNNPASPSFSNSTNFFPQNITNLPSGSALVRLIALRQFAAQNNTTNQSGSTQWFGRIVQREF